MDRLTPLERSRQMSRIRGKDTQPEMVVRRLAHGLGYRYRLHVKHLPGTPDLVFASRHKIIFVHGCFWHGHHCGRGFKPKTNETFWATKIRNNRTRDARCLKELRRLGWHVLVIWECATQNNRQESLRSKLQRFLDG